MSLYNSVPYDKCEKPKMNSIIETRIDTCNINYNIYINDVIHAVMHLKSGKSDGNEGLHTNTLTREHLSAHIRIQLTGICTGSRIQQAGRRLILYAYLISIHNLVIYKHILIIEKYYMIISIGVKDNVMLTVS